MYKIFRNSLTKPSLIFPHISDKMRRAVSFFFLMVIITLIPIAISLGVNSDGMLPGDQKQFQALYRDGLADNYYIVDGELQYTNDSVSKIGLRTENYVIVYGNKAVDNQTIEMPFVFRLQTDGIEYQTYSMNSVFYTYNELGLTNLDLSVTDSSTQLLRALNSIVIDNIITHHLTIFLIVFISNVISMLFVVLLLSLFVLKPIPFKLKLKLNLFLIAPLALTQFFGALFGLSDELFIVGIIWVAFNSLRLFRNIGFIRKW